MPSEVLSLIMPNWKEASKTDGRSAANPPLFDPGTGVSRIPVVIKGTGISPFSFTTSWSELYGKTHVIFQETPEEVLLTRRQINPESVRALVDDTVTPHTVDIERRLILFLK